MKIFIASIITFLLIIILITGYLFFLNYTINQLNVQINKILIDLEENDWLSLKNNYEELSENWQKNKSWLEGFSNHSKTDQIDQVITEIEKLIDFKDKKQLVISTNKLKLFLHFLYDDELPTIENII